MFKKTFAVILSFAFSFPSALFGDIPVSTSLFREQSLTWIKNGDLKNLMGHVYDGDMYITVDELARMSQSQLRWQNVSQEACMTRAAGQLCFNWGKSEVIKDGKAVRKKVAFKFDNEELYVPIRFATSKEFQSYSGDEFSWDSKRHQLTQTDPVTVQIPQVEKMDDRYRLSLPAPSDIPHYLLQKNDQKIWIRFVRGVSQGSQILEGDSVIEEVRIVQHRHSADLILKTGPDAVSNDVFFDSNRKKLVVDIFVSPRMAAVIKKELLSDQPVRMAKQIGFLEKPKEQPASKSVEPASKDEPVRAKLDVAPAKSAAAASVVTAPSAAAAVKESAAKVQETHRRSLSAGAASHEIRTIVVDAGHGGIDSGAIGSHGTMEKNINLEVAKNLANVLRKDKNFKVILTRDSDEFIPLSKRTEIANNAEADLFISIHCNASLSAKNSGFEVYFLSASATDKAAEAVARIENSVVSLEEGKNKPISKLGELLASMAVYNYINESSKCAALICKTFTNKSGAEKTMVKEADFYVLRGAQMPAVLVELDYLSNPIIELKLRSSRYRSKMVKGLADGIAAYNRRVQKSQEASSLRNRKAEATSQ